jgi:phosphoribosylamine-glycine ligase
LQQNSQKSLLIKIIFIATFTLLGFLILLYMILNALEDPRILKRTFGFDSFASFVFMSSGGILTVVILSTLVIFVIRSLIFSKKLHGPVDALHRALVRLEEGDYKSNPEGMQKLPAIIQNDLEALRHVLIERHAVVERCISDLKGVAQNLRRITVDSSLRISFLVSQLDNFDIGVERLEQTFAHIRVSRPNTFSSVLILGNGPEALSLASALIHGEDAALVWLFPLSNEDIEALHASLPIQGKVRFACPALENENDIIAFIRRENIPLCIIAEANEENARLGALLIKEGVHTFGLSLRENNLTRDHNSLWTLFTQAKIPCLPIGAEPELGWDYAFTAIADRHTIRILSAAEIALRIKDDDTGRMSSGMGAFAPAFTAEYPLLSKVQRLFCKKIHAIMRRKGIIHRGFVNLRIWESEKHELMLRSIDFGLRAPECEVNLLSFGHGIAHLALAACKDELSREKLTPERYNAISIVFRPNEGQRASTAEDSHGPDSTDASRGEAPSMLPHPALPQTPWNMRTARYPAQDPDGRCFALVCSRTSERETIHSAYHAALPILQEGHFYCRQDIGSKTLLLNEIIRVKPVKAHREPLLRRMAKWFANRT